MFRRVVVVFAKPPEPGRVKTRLAGDLSPQTAARLASAFLSDLLERLESDLADREIEVRVAWALADGEKPPAGTSPWFPQASGDLGDRLLAAANRIATEGDLPVLIGADLPDLAPRAIEDAFAALAGGSDLVLGPASDGGFYLIGLGEAARRPELFDGIEWGGDRVLARTLSNGRELRLRIRMLDEASDVDRPEDLAPLLARLSRRASESGVDECPRTRALLEGLAKEGRIASGDRAEAAP